MIARLLIVAIAVALLAAPAPASADGDPASDVLLQQDVFFPYAPPTSNGVARALLELTDRTRKAGWPIKVAIIATPDDLGAVARMFDFPERYAKLLSRETGDPRLLVVTPNGFASRQLGDGVDRTLKGLEPVERGGDALARQALIAVARLAEQAGHGVARPKIDRSAAGRRPYRERIAAHSSPQVPSAAPPATPTPGGDGSTSGGAGGTAWWLYVLPVLVVVVVLVLQNLRERRAEAAARAGGHDHDR